MGAELAQVAGGGLFRPPDSVVVIFRVDLEKAALE